MRVPPEALRHLRSDLRGLVALELLQLTLGGGALMALSVRAAWLTEDPATAVAITVTLFLALAYVAMAFLVRMGQDGVRRDLYVLQFRDEEAAREDSIRQTSLRGASVHPYRSMPPRQREEQLQNLRRGLRSTRRESVSACYMHTDRPPYVRIALAALTLGASAMVVRVWFV